MIKKIRGWWYRISDMMVTEAVVTPSTYEPGVIRVSTCLGIYLEALDVSVNNLIRKLDRSVYTLTTKRSTMYTLCLTLGSINSGYATYRVVYRHEMLGEETVTLCLASIRNIFRHVPETIYVE